MPRLRIVLATALAALTLSAPLARAGTYSRVLGTYQQNGSIPPCEFSSAQLQSALKSVSTYGAQYFADFTNAIQNALAARAAGQCSRRSSRATAAASRGGTIAGSSASTAGSSASTAGSSASTAGPSTSGSSAVAGTPTTAPTLPPVTAATKASIPLPWLAMGAIALVLAVFAAVAALARLRGWDPAWAAASSHSWREAGYRISGVWSEFRDWLRSA